MELDNLQKEAIRACCEVEHRVVGITGGAGTGKTTIMKEVYRHLVDAGYRVALCAPTGKAANRIYEATGEQAMTIHRLLRFGFPDDVDPNTGKSTNPTYPSYHKGNRMPYDCVLADEYTMVTHFLHRCLLDALPAGGRVCCFGDNNQLPPVEDNKKLAAQPSPFTNVLRDHHSITLDRLYRQGEGSGIVENARRVTQGRALDRFDDFSLTFTSRPPEALAAYIRESIQAGHDFGALDHQVITPQNTGWVGTHKLNQLLLDILMPEVYDDWTPIPRNKWDEKFPVSLRKGVKVLWTKNNYDLNILNGETGIVQHTDPHLGSITIDFGDRVVEVPPEIETVDRNGRTVSYDPRKNLYYAYAITTHKSQGSEYQRVVYVLASSMVYQMNRRNFYTAITRARKHVQLITDQRGYQISLTKKGDR